MAKKKMLGMEIGNCQLKIAVCSDYCPERIVVADIPDNLVNEDAITSSGAMAEFIRETLSENKITYKNVCMVLPEKFVYTKRLVLPPMTVEQLKVNLPYEFHDYIASDKDRYIYDYSVVEKREDESGNLTEMELIAVAAPKELIEKYKAMLRRAGLRLVLIAPEFAAVHNILKDYEAANGIREKNDYVVLDIGHRSVKLFFFTKCQYEVTRIMEPGCAVLDSCIAKLKDVDPHTAKIIKEENKDNVLYEQECRDIYAQMAIEIMRVVNFYNFNHPDNNIDAMYYCGGGALIEPLLEAVRENVEMNIESLTKLYSDEYDDMRKILIGFKALGITWV